MISSISNEALFSNSGRFQNLTVIALSLSSSSYYLRTHSEHNTESFKIPSTFQE